MNQIKAKESVLDFIKKHASAKAIRGLTAARRADLNRFISAFFAPSSLDDLKESDPKRLFAIACSTWRLADKRPPDTPLVRVFNPDPRKDGWKTSHTVIQIINDDMPFLVDSIIGGLSNTFGLRIHIMHHPVLHVKRNDSGQRIKTSEENSSRKTLNSNGIRESYIYVEVDAQPDAKELKKLEDHLFKILDDIKHAVDGWKPILAKADEALEELDKYSHGKNKALFQEAKAFIDWLVDDNFTFLGYREYDFHGTGKKRTLRQNKKSGLGILTDPNRHVMRGTRGQTSESNEISDFLKTDRPLLITKANTRTTVHRPVHMDYISVKKFDKSGKPSGERQFVGLFTSKSYLESPRRIPVLRKKVANIQKRAPHSSTSHAGKAITHILETFPRDELFLVKERHLLKTTLGILHLLDRPRPRAFIREDPYERYVSAIVYVPRENYHSALRQKIEKIICDAYQGEVSVYYALLSEDVLARWHFIIRTKPGQVPKVDHAELNALLELSAKPWTEGLREELVEAFDEAKGLELYDKYRLIFSEAYKEAFSPRQAITDIHHFQGFDLNQDVSFEAFREEGDPEYVIRLNIYHPSRLIALSECLPMLENLGVKVIGENSYELMTKDRGWIHAFYLETPNHGHVNIAKTEVLIEPLLDWVWKGEVENDSFNALAIHAGLAGHDIVILRAYAKFLRQLGVPFSQNLFETTLFETPRLARRLVKLFYVMFQPRQGKKEERLKKANAIVREINTNLNRIKSLDQDRIIRAYLNAILATVRTNFFTDESLACTLPKTSKEAEVPVPALAFKIRSSQLEDAPKPKPFMEIFVYSPRVEGVHLRGGPVARGGLRWSDRREDFRTEVLGLMKAQQVKNAVIVPVGAKGGFYPKLMPAQGTRDEILQEGLSCYRIFVRSLLSVTDNLKGKKVIPPKGVFRWDDDDPYLVVAADKGTAAFSDEANEIAKSVGFWLDDAFASGGSNGYDHKKMGITARGAGVSIASHLQELGINIGKEPVTVIGVGDMSGDVFGNGMLLSKNLKLIAAFDHRHIFFDPDPDPAKSFVERQRLFDKPRSNWTDYNPKIISEGGGVFPRDSKVVKLNKIFRKFLGVDAKELTPDEVIYHILRAEADLLWFGGIGTYVKAAKETHGDVGDRANDGVRVNGEDLRVRVIGEGGNLACTQNGRIAFARKGGRVNTDFIDNSAGVDCSDKEVNIKILLARAIEKGKLNPKRRNALLASMTDEVADIVLQDNYLQTRAISIAELQAAQKREQHRGLIRKLEKEKRIDRALEKLPSDQQFSKLALKGRGLSRPDLAVLVAFAKLRLKDRLLESKILDNKILLSELAWGFPKRLRKRFAAELGDHHLRREIIATTLANEVINRGGLTFVTEIEEETGLSMTQIVSAFLVARDAFNLKKMWAGIDAIDYSIPAAVQTEMRANVQNFLKRQAIWFLKHLKRPLKINRSIALYHDKISEIMKHPDRVWSALEQKQFRDRMQDLMERGAPPAMAKKVTTFAVMPQVCDIVNVAIALKREVADVGLAYFEVGRVLGFNWLRQTTGALVEEDHWEYLATHSIIDDLADQQRELTRSILEAEKNLKGCDAVSDWVLTHKIVLKRSSGLLNDLKSSGALNVAKLSFAARHLRSILPRN